MAMKTQGTELYVIDPEDGSVILVGCVTSIDGIDTTVPQVPTTCLASTASEYVGGMPEPGQATFGLNLDPTDATHIRLHQLKREGNNLQWAIGWRDGWNSTTGVGTPPTTVQDSAGDWSFVTPTTRTWLTFEGFLAAFPFSAPLNGVWASTVGVQISGDPEWTPKTT